jgi:hypothetical protein
MNSDVSSQRHPSITARPTAEEKQLFIELAASRGLSESALAIVAIRALLDSNHPIRQPGTSPAREPATDRIIIRLRPGDRRAINVRAAAPNEDLGVSRSPRPSTPGREPAARD